MERILGDFLSIYKSYDKEIMNEHFLNAYNDIPLNQLIHLRDIENLRFYLTSSNRSNMKKALICSSKKYFVYDLDLIL